MLVMYTYKEQTYYSLNALSEALGKDGIFIPLSISNEELESLGVTIEKQEKSLEQLKRDKIYSLKNRRDSLEVTPIVYNKNTYEVVKNGKQLH